MDEVKKTESLKEWFVNNRTTSVFLIIAFICSVITILAFCRSTNLLHESQDKIVNNQTAHINKIDTVISTMQTNALKAFEINDSKLQKLISDSLLKKTPKLDSLQKIEVAKYVKIIISASASELAYKDWIKELNTTFTQKEIAQIQLESKSLLELEFNKIQNEYDTLALWGGILTIVFLIFSFYSLFKTDDLVKQGRDGLDKLNDRRNEANILYNESRREYDDLKDKISKFNKDIEALDNRKTKQDAEIKKISDEIFIQKVDLALITKLRAELVALVDDIAQAKKDILDLQSRMNNAITYTVVDKNKSPEELENGDGVNENQSVLEEPDDEPKGEEPDSDIEPKDSELK